MNAFLNLIEESKISDKEGCLRRIELTTLQVNMGNLCNQSCLHCHVSASPRGKKVMGRRVVDDILSFLKQNPGLSLDITGGAPELNPNFDYFILEAKPLVKELSVRTNLTVFFEPGKEYLPDFFMKNRVRLICSLPCYQKESVDAQRGKGVYDKSIRALRILNRLGYAKMKDLSLTLVYNPTGPYLPPQQDRLEAEYREFLKKNYDIEFDKLLTITNAPIKRFKKYLNSNGEYKNYLRLLKKSFNPEIVDNIMCRKYLSVGYDGRLYDCDFNQSLGWVLKNKKGQVLTIDKIRPQDLKERKVMVGEHCLSCTAGFGSSCQGALLDEVPIGTDSDIKQTVRSYYGLILKSKKDLKTSVCCSAESVYEGYKHILKLIHSDVKERFYGCGSPIPPLLEGCVVLDLGCGTGRDSYLASSLVGETGFVIGVDMTKEQLDIAKRYVGYHMKKFGYSRPNIEFRLGLIEDLESLRIEANSVDVVISNCVINLSEDKRSVFSEIFRVLKPGGELYFSDIFAGRRVPAQLASDPVLYGECLGGAMYIEDFRRLLNELGCRDYRVIRKSRVNIGDSNIEKMVGNIDFYSMTIRTFKLEGLEDICEDYGQIGIYLGGIKECPYEFILDDHHIFELKRPKPICGNTALMLQNTRYAKYFEVIGDTSIHFGPFACKPQASAPLQTDTLSGSCC